MKCFLSALLACMAAATLPGQTPGVPGDAAWKASMLEAERLWREGRYAPAEAVLREALKEAEKSGPEDPKVAATLGSLASVYQDQGRFGEAEHFYQRSIRVLSKDRRNVLTLAASLNNLADLYLETNQYAKAEPLLRRCLEIRTSVLGPEDPLVAMALNNLGSLHKLRMEWDEAEKPFSEALAIFEKKLGPADQHVAEVLINLVQVCQKNGHSRLAMEYSERALAILRKNPRTTPSLMAKALNSRATLSLACGQPQDAELYLREAVATAEKALGPDHPSVGGLLSNYALVLRRLKRKHEAGEYEKRARKILAQSNRDNHLGYTVDVTELAAR